MKDWLKAKRKPPKPVKKKPVRGPSRKLAHRGDKTPRGYKVVYEWPDSDYVTHRRKVFVKKK